jgi:DNA-binding transcriptional regulator YhcF (GntR family)
MDFGMTDRVRKVLAMAREETIRLGHGHVGTEHILLGLLRDQGGVGAAALAKLGVEPEPVRERLTGALRPGKPAVRLPSKLPYTAGAKKVLEEAMLEARELRHSYVGTEHLLMGLLREEKGQAAQVLNAFGVTVALAREEVLSALGNASLGPGAERGRGGGWLQGFLGGGPRRAAASAFVVTIDDASTVSIYEQIVVQAQEAVATGRLRPGDRLPPVRRLADELDIAPGTVARAYAELERLGMIVTEGARGTRVAAQPANPLPESERPETLAGLLRPVAVAAFHLGASASEVRAALEKAMAGIYNGGAEVVDGTPDPEG